VAPDADVLPLGQLSDDRLVALFRAGCEGAFGVLHGRHSASLLRVARRMLEGSGHDPEDVVQDVFLRAHIALRATDNAITVGPWLSTIARNRALDVLGSGRRSRELKECRRLCLVSSTDPERATELRDRMRRVVDEIGRLPERQRMALVSRVLEGASYAELAARLDATLPATKALLVRARSQLRQAEADAA
jgi:RNA polymerase sigma-70 factor (ECF subfamily)